MKASILIIFAAVALSCGPASKRWPERAAISPAADLLPGAWQQRQARPKSLGTWLNIAADHSFEMDRGLRGVINIVGREIVIVYSDNVSQRFYYYLDARNLWLSNRFYSEHYTTDAIVLAPGE